ncbi:VOC family protein [Mycobacterium sp. RTGN5]|uniref:2-oxoadipate dioxygenase/decarboxylase n=1 Tax=Mycobacterium sp. RTGN5 TaxID=3016522 RepID=UPI0029C6B91F|nr:VOC family protein [Mycobacterium sp. RTGN5]
MRTPDVPIWQLRARFAAALSTMYGTEVPAYTTLVEVSEAVNRDYVAAHPQAERLGSIERVTAERHGAIRVGTPGELTDVADLFAAFGMYPVGYYDLREAASPVPVVSTAFRPVDAAELARNPFRVFTSMLATRDGRFFDTGLRHRIDEYLRRRTVFDPELIADARRIATSGGCDADTATAFVTRAVAAFALCREPVDRAWYAELTEVSAVAADIAGVPTTHINHLTPRVLDIEDLYRRMTARGITMIDAIQGPPHCDGPDVLLRQTSFRALAEPRRFLETDGTVTDGTLRVRFGEVEARGVALTRKGRERYDAAMAGADPAAVWGDYFPTSDDDMASQGLAYYHRGDPEAPVVYEDFLPASAAGIFRSNLDADTEAAGVADESGYDIDWMAGTIGRRIHDPYDLYDATAQEAPA